MHVVENETDWGVTPKGNHALRDHDYALSTRMINSNNNSADEQLETIRKKRRLDYERTRNTNNSGADSILNEVSLNDRYVNSSSNSSGTTYCPSLVGVDRAASSEVDQGELARRRFNLAAKDDDSPSISVKLADGDCLRLRMRDESRVFNTVSEC